MDGTLVIERSTRASRLGGWVAGLVFLALAAMPWWGERADIRLLTEFFYMLALAQMWNLLCGFGGLLSVGQQAFIGLGAYTLVVAGLKLGLNPFLTVPLAGLVCALVAVPAAAVLFRLRGAYFAVGTWVVAEVCRLLVANVSWVGGGSGLSVTETMRGLPVWWRESLTFWIALGLGVGAMAGIYLLLRSRWGLALTAVRDSEVASASLGVNVKAIKWAVYVAAAFGTGAVGALIYISKLRVSPGAAFAMDWSAVLFFMVVIGGIGTLEGPLLGAVVYFVLRELLSDYGSAYMIVLGAFAVTVMLTAPKGLWGLLTTRFDLRFFPVQRRVRE